MPTARQMQIEQAKSLTDREMFAALQLMERQGGSFASNLAKAWQRADLHNQRRLMDAFGDLLMEYHVREGMQ